MTSIRSRFLHVAARVLASAACIGALPLFAAQDKVYERGFDRTGVYDFHDVDSVNMMNGNLSATIPLGQEYRTNGTIAYSFRLIYNSNVWEYKGSDPSRLSIHLQNTIPPIPEGSWLGSCNQPDQGVESYPHPDSNAGFGWKLGLGDLRELTSTFAYVTPDGNEHEFVSRSLHADSDPVSKSDPAPLFTRDGSYLRLRRLDSVTREVDFPDGTRRRFQCVSDSCETQPDLGTSAWGLSQITDPFGNIVYIQRSPDKPQVGQRWTWTIRESFVNADRHANAVADAGQLLANEVRNHVLRFTVHQMAGTVATGRQIVLDEADLAAVATARAVYRLGYKPKAVYRDRGAWWDRNGVRYPFNAARKLDVLVLESVTLPSPAGVWRMQYYEGDETECPASGSCARGQLLNGTGFTTISFGQENCGNIRTIPMSHVSGRLRRLELPTLGAIEYRYGVRLLPLKYCVSGVAPTQVFSGIGVATRWTIKPNATAQGEVEGEWNYRAVAPPQSELWPVQTTFNGGCRPPRELTSAVIDPLGVVTLNYFSVYTSGTTLSNHTDSNLRADQGWRVAEHGLPFSREEKRNGRFISSRTFDCRNRDGKPDLRQDALDDILLSAAPRAGQRIWGRGGEQLCGAPALEQWVRYEDNGESCQSIDECRVANTRAASESTVYPDDPSFTYDTDRSDYDGLGNYRTVVTSGAGFSDVKTAFTGYNPQAAFDGVTLTVEQRADWPVVTTRWLLGLYDRITIQEGTGRAETHYDFDSVTGFLKGKRVLAATLVNGSVSLQQHDLLVRYSRQLATDSKQRSVLRVDEHYFGGDVKKSAPMSSAFAAPAGNPEYHIVRLHRAGTESEVWYDQPSLSCDARELTLMSNEVDRNTGLIASVQNASGEVTAYAYDLTGRLTEIRPQGSASGAAAKTFLQYAIATEGWGGIVTETVADSPAATVPQRQRKYVYDHMGRLARERERVPNGWAEVATSYDVAGRKTATTVPGPIDHGGPATSWTLDVFGRPTKEVRWDGSVTTYGRSGDRVVDEEVKQLALINEGTPSGQTPANARKTLTKDRHGRLASVAENSTGSEMVPTRYGYDALDQLVTVTVPAAGSVAGQTRRFLYDHRGFVTAEVHPERPGVALHYTRDTRGNVHDQVLKTSVLATAPATTITTAELDRFGLSLYYDGAERLIRVAAKKLLPGDTRETTLKTFRYHPRSNTSDRPATFAHNKLNVAVRHNWVPNPWAVGKVIEIPVTEEYFYDGQTGRMSSKDIRMQSAVARTDFGYNTAGDLARIDYPTLSCANCATIAQRAVEQVEMKYSFGRLSEIPRFTQSFTFHDNGMWNTVRRLQLNGALAALDAQDLEENGIKLPRTLNLSTAFSLGSTWHHGPFAYDGAGNIRQIGSQTYRYDRAGRLRQATEFGVQSDLQYDHHGNLLRSGADTFTVDGKTNRVQSSATAAMGAQSWTYDVLGNVTRVGAVKLDYDPLGRQTRVDAPTFGRVFLYDPHDERVAVVDYKAAGAIPWKWSVRGLNNEVLSDFTLAADQWTWTRDYVYRDGALLASEWKEGTAMRRRHFHTDHLGSVRRESSDSGRPLPSHEFTPFGIERSPVADTNRMKFTGHERDGAETSSFHDDFDYMHARFYNATYGRFLSVDPVNGRPDAPQSWNRYSYVMNNPLNATDPDGRQARTKRSSPNPERRAVIRARTEEDVRREEAQATRRQAAAAGGMNAPGTTTPAAPTILDARVTGAQVPQLPPTDAEAFVAPVLVGIGEGGPVGPAIEAVSVGINGQRKFDMVDRDSFRYKLGYAIGWLIDKGTAK